MRTHPNVWIALALGQVLLIALGAAHFDFFRWGRIGLPLGMWSAVTAASSRYGFFAPGVGSELKATFELIDSAGQVTTDTLAHGNARELELRIGNIVRTFGDRPEEARIRHALVASWAGKMFARHPGTDTVVVRIEGYDLPSMSAYASGLRPGWSPYYRASFRLAGAGPGGGQ